MIYREATSSDINGLFEIWTTCFTDDYPYIENYFKYCFPHTKTLVAATDSGEIASSITLIPATARIEDKIIMGRSTVFIFFMCAPASGGFVGFQPTF